MLLIFVSQLQKLTSTQKLQKLKRKYLTMKKYLTTPEFNKLTNKNFAEKSMQSNLGRKNDIADFEKRQILMKN